MHQKIALVGYCLVSAWTLEAQKVPEKLRASWVEVSAELEKSRSFSAKDLKTLLLQGAKSEDEREASKQLGVFYANRSGTLSLNLLQYARGEAKTPEEIDEIDYYLVQTYAEMGAYASALSLGEELVRKPYPKELRRDLYRIMLMSSYQLGQGAKFVELFRAYEQQVPRSEWPEELVLAATEVAPFYPKAQIRETDLLESLAVNYPISPISRAAYHRLEALSKGPEQYTFSVDLLQRIYANRELEEGLAERVLEKLRNPIRYSDRGKAYKLSDLERVYALHRLRAWPEARDLSLSILKEKTLDPRLKQQTLRLLAVALNKLGAHEDSQKAYASYFKEFSDPQDKGLSLDKEAYARLLNTQGDYRGAAYTYASLAKQGHKPLHRWLHFWNLYLAKADNEALALLERPGYVEPLEPDEPVLDYWKARIYERLGKKAKAEELFATLHEDEPLGFYAMLLDSKAERQPSLKQAIQNVRVKLAESDGAGRLARPLYSMPRAQMPVSENYSKYLEPLALAVGVNHYAVLSIMRAESGFNPRARSPVGAMGLMQIMPATGYQIARLLDDHTFDVYKLSEPMTNMAYGSFYYSHLVQYYSGNYVLATAAYNAGPNAVNGWLKACKQCDIDEFVEGIPYKETRRYVKKVMRFYGEYSRLEQERTDVQMLTMALPQSLPQSYPVF